MSNKEIPDQRGPEAGFTLPETLVAFVIAALALTALLPAFGLSAGGSLEAQRRSAALRLAESLLAEAAQAPFDGASVHDGQTEDGYRWRIETEVREGGDVTALITLSATVAWTSARRSAPASLTLQTLRARWRD